METQTETDRNRKVSGKVSQKITPFFWFNNQAEEVVKFYTSVFKNSGIGKVVRYNEAGAGMSGMPKGSVMTVEFRLEDMEFTAINGGPVFTHTPSISFMVSCNTIDEIDNLWNKLSQGGKVLMELQKYPFSERFGWLEDKYGVSWQLIMGNYSQKITPFLWFGNHAEEAMKFYTSLFNGSAVKYVEHFGANDYGLEGAVRHAIFTLGGQDFMAMDSNKNPFNPAISFVVNCETQDEVDYYWEKLGKGGDERAKQCGWLADKYGVSWQIVPIILPELISDPNPKKSEKVMETMGMMKKLDIEGLMLAYDLAEK